MYLSQFWNIFVGGRPGREKLPLTNNFPTQAIVAPDSFQNQMQRKLDFENLWEIHSMLQNGTLPQFESLK